MKTAQGSAVFNLLLRNAENVPAQVVSLLQLLLVLLIAYSVRMPSLLHPSAALDFQRHPVINEGEVEPKPPLRMEPILRGVCWKPELQKTLFHHLFGATLLHFPLSSRLYQLG